MRLAARPLSHLWVVLSGVLCCRAALAAEPAILSIRAETDTVGVYDKFELTIDAKADFTNPFDPAEIDIAADFTSPSGRTYHIWGFYNPSSWNSLWMIRFAPTETGTWKYVVTVADRQGNTRSDARELEVVPSSHHGFLGIAENQRYLTYSDGTPFYGVGLWYNDSYELFNRGNITEAALDDLQRRGANFISFFPTPLETMGTGLGRYDQNRCGRLDQLFERCEARNLHISWNIWFHSYLSETVWGGSNARYRNNPYRRIADSVDFYASDETWKYQERLYRYIIARWGYSRALFLWFVIDEINGTEGWTKGDQAAAEAWCRRVDAFFNRHDPYGRPTTGTQSGGIGQWWPAGYEIFDIAAREIYEAQGHPIPKSGKLGPDDASPLQLSYLNYATQVQNLWKRFPKPAIIGECGWDHTYYEPGMPGYLAMYHNALWVSLVNGSCATPFWWSYSERINDSVVTNQMLHFARFVAGIDFTAARIEPVDVGAGECDAWALKTDDMIFGWLVHPKTSVANETLTIANLPERNYRVRLYHTWGATTSNHNRSNGKITASRSPFPNYATSGDTHRISAMTWRLRFSGMTEHNGSMWPLTCLATFLAHFATFL